MKTDVPAVSVIIPAYDSHETIAGCLAALAAQTFRDFETIVVDSGPDGTTARLIATSFPWVRFERSPRRLLPHAARNRGIEIATSDVMVFTDPDIYAHGNWLEHLVAAHARTGAVIVGALACHGDLWRDQGIHLCKFSKWLPAGRPRLVDMSPTANMLITRRDFQAAGGLPGDEMLGDVSLSWRLREGGRALHFEPEAVVEHHHLQTVRSFLRERYIRGKMFGHLRGSRLGGASLLAYLLASVLPVRLPRILALVARHAATAGQTGRFLATLPLIALGHGASLAGEAAAYASRLASKAHLS